MKNTLAISSIIFTLGFLSIPVVQSDSDFSWSLFKNKSNGVKVVRNELYEEECGGCHMAYAPGLLTERSWTKVMAGLEDHFSDNAELDDDSFKQISQFLNANSADKSNYKRSQKFSRNINRANPPLRITKTPYFIREHNEIPDRLVAKNPKVVSFSRCTACHKNADAGSFNEHDINIPGFGRWDD